MILENSLPRIKDYIELANHKDEPQDVTFVYQEMNTHDTIHSVFKWLFNNNIEFSTRYDQMRFVVVVHPKRD